MERLKLPTKTEPPTPCLMGIDAGLNGGLAVVRNGVIIGTSAMTVTESKRIDIYALQQFIILWNVKNAFVELQFLPPRRNRGALTTIRNFERIVTTLELCDVNVTEVGARKWQRAMLPSDYRERFTDTKEASITTALTLGVDVPKRGPRARKYGGYHDGVADAALIALYGWATLKKKTTIH